MTDHHEGDGEDAHITRRELGLQLRAFRNEVRILVVGAVVVIRFDLPNELTATALAVLVGKIVLSFAFGGKNL